MNLLRLIRYLTLVGCVFLLFTLFSKQAFASSYNIQGWLTGLFGTRYTQSIAYETGPAPQFNGNIAGVTYQNQGDILREYRYSYDRLSRLTAAHPVNK